MQMARECVLACYRKRQPVMLTGKPGMGKTAMIESICRDEQLSFIDFRLALRDPVDVGGMRVPDTKTGLMKWYQPSELPDVKRHGEKGLLTLDEINAVPMSLQVVAYGIIQERRIGDWHMPEGWSTIALGNHLTDRAGAQRMSTALANRFLHLNVEPDLDSWIKQYGAEHVDARYVAFLRFRPNLFHVMPDSPDEKAFPSARSHTAAAQFIDEPAAVRLHLFSGAIGNAAAGELEAFLRVFERLPTIDQILTDPNGAKLPDEHDPATQYAVVGAIARNMTRKTIGPFMQYASRLPREFQIVAMHDATKRDESLTRTAEYGQWAVANSDMVL
jgi:hypothetical protein